VAHLKINFKRQSGTALITVVLIAAVVIIMVLESVKTIRYQKQLSSNLINRDQAASYLMGMEELAKIWLKKSFENSKDENVHLNQTWAQDDITFPLDGGGMAASISDMQSCFNLNSLLSSDTTQNEGRDPARGSSNEREESLSEDVKLQDSGLPEAPIGQQIYEELVNQVQQDSEITGKALAAVLRDWLDDDAEPFEADGAEDGYYQSMEIPYRTGNGLISHVSELRAMKDYSHNIFIALLPYVCVLPDGNVNQINVNTVHEERAELLYAALGGKGISLSDVKDAISNRGEKGFESVEEFIDELGANKDKINKKFKARLGVKSEYFQMTAKAEIGKTRVAMKTLFKKDDKNNFKVVSRYFGKDIAPSPPPNNQPSDDTDTSNGRGR
jgi:general secretion pathway protein K